MAEEVSKGEVLVDKGEVTPEQMQEIEAGEFLTPGEVASKLKYSYQWVLWMCQGKRIKGIKPLGGRWRIPRSEYERLLKEGIQPLPRGPTDKPAVTEIVVGKEVERKVREPEKKVKPSLFPFDFTNIFGGKK